MILLQGFHQEVEQGRLVVSAKETGVFFRLNKKNCKKYFASTFTNRIQAPLGLPEEILLYGYRKSANFYKILHKSVSKQS
jgi:hypothetical protein